MQLKPSRQNPYAVAGWSDTTCRSDNFERCWFLSYNALCSDYGIIKNVYVCVYVPVVRMNI